ncbi:MAG: PKD domain-containing protein [Saprospiraceae bacterium]|nr:PKD domain-containing protein [Saprospiraceae bacterium]
MYISLRFLFLFAAVLGAATLFAQPDCGCNQCDIPIIPDNTRSFSLGVTGYTHALGQNGQAVAEVEIDVAHDFIGTLSMSLTSPNGTNVPLIASLNPLDTSYFSRWKIKLVRCSAPTAPDPGMQGQFSANNNWPNSAVMTGSYHPHGCLENFNSGTVNGTWYLNVTNNGYAGIGFIYGFKIRFTNQAGNPGCAGLNYEVYAGESCATAQPLPPDVWSFVGNTAPYGPDGIQSFCGTIENDQWYTFVSACDTVVFTLTPGFCINGDGIQIALYDDCFNPTLTTACNPGCQNCGWSSLTLIAGVIPGQQYYIVIDGFAGDQCDFYFEVPPTCFQGLANPTPNDFELDGCEGDNAFVGLSEIPFGAAGYIWKATNGALVNGQTQVVVPGPENTTVELTFGDGDGEICVAAYNFTDTTAFICFPFTADTNLFLEEIASVCYDELPYISEYSVYGLPPLYQAGTFTFTLFNYVDEDGSLYPCPVKLTIHLTVEGSFANLPPVAVLGTEYVFPNGDIITESGSYFWADTLPSGCRNDFSQQVYLVNWWHEGDGCSPDTVFFDFSSAGNVGVLCPGALPPFANGPGIKQVVYQSPGVYDFTLLLGAQQTVYDDILTLNFDPPVQPGFSMSFAQNVVTFTNTSQNATQYLWDFGDGTTSAEVNPVHTYAAPGPYTVTLTAWGVCPEAIRTQTFIIPGQLPQAAFIFSQNEGCAPLTVNFADQSVGEPGAWHWEFPGGEPAVSNEENPVVTYNAPGTYTVTLTFENVFGQSTLTQTDIITVHPPAVAAFQATVNQSLVSFTNLSQNGLNFVWEFGDGNSSTETSPQHTYTNPGTYLVTLIVNGLCGFVLDTQSVVIAGQAPQAAFSLSQNQGCVPLVIQFQDQSAGNPDTWAWQFPGGTPDMATVQNPSVIYLQPGIYDVILTVQNVFGENTLTQTAIVSAAPLPSVAFSADVDELSVAFNNLSSGAATYLWDFGDGQNSTDIAPTHLYQQAGTYLVVLTATNTCGSSIVEQWITVSTSVAGAPSELAWLRVLPNPSNGVMHLELRDAPSSRLSWRICNAIGQTLQQESEGRFEGYFSKTLDFSHLPAGMYWIEVQTLEKRSLLKVILE